MAGEKVAEAGEFRRTCTEQTAHNDKRTAGWKAHCKSVNILSQEKNENARCVLNLKTVANSARAGKWCPCRAQPAGQPAARQLQGSIQKSEPRFATLISPLLIVN